MAMASPSLNPEVMMASTGWKTNPVSALQEKDLRGGEFDSYAARHDQGKRQRSWGSLGGLVWVAPVMRFMNPPQKTLVVQYVSMQKVVIRVKKDEIQQELR
jgi:hypothetical protein